MNDTVVVNPGPAAPAEALPGMLVAPLRRLHAAAGPGALERYLVACAAVQFWADLRALAATVQVEAALEQAQRAAMAAARALLRPEAASPAPAAPGAVALAWQRQAARAGLLDKLLWPPMPECCGYDLADLELVPRDGARLIERIGTGRPVLVVGIRTGGAYLAPLWSAALDEQGVTSLHWCTVRPAAGGAIHGIDAAQAWLERHAAATVVLLDDQPDTGATMEQVAAALRARAGALWYASVGKLWRDDAGQRVAIHAGPALLPDRNRLWESLLPADHARFLARLADGMADVVLPAGARLRQRCPHGEARYGLGQAWLPWNHPQVTSGRRQLVNPRKTPLTVEGPDGQPLLHLRFVGAGPFGRAEFQRVQALDPDRRAWFQDGYCVTPDAGPLRLLRAVLHEADEPRRRELLRQCAARLTAAARQPDLVRPGALDPIEPAPRWLALARRAQERAAPLPARTAALQAFLERPVRRGGTTGSVFRSSLRYACGAWHWQVDLQGRVRRFQQEANWGELSWPELELAAFLAEHRLVQADARHLAALCALPYEEVRDCLPLAALLIGEAMLRSVRAVSPAGRAALHDDFRHLFATIHELADIAEH